MATLSVTGERTIAYSAKNLPHGLSIENGIISGMVENGGVYSITLIAENKLGTVFQKVAYDNAARLLDIH